MHAQARLLTSAVLALAAGLTFTFPVHADRAARRVETWYQRYLGREPDPDGFRTYTNQLRQGRPPMDIEADILSSDEYWRRAGSNPAGWVNRLYMDTTGQLPQPREFRYWVNRVRFEDRTQIARDFLSQLYAAIPWQ